MRWKSPVECGVLGILFGVIGLLVIAAFFLSPAPASQYANGRSPVGDAIAIITLCFVVFIAPAIAAITWWRRAEITADQRELTWRGLGRRHRIQWQDITDYYKQTHANCKTPRSVVEAGQTKLQLDTYIGRQSELQSLREVIADRAINARADGWAEFGIRQQDKWPRSFGYPKATDRGQRLHLLGLRIMAGYLILSPSFYFLPDSNKPFSWSWSNFSSIFPELGWLLGICFALIVGAFILAGPLMAIVVLCHVKRIKEDLEQRRRQRIIATPEKLAYRDEYGRVEVTWDQVTSYSKNTSPGVFDNRPVSMVETTYGAFTFSTSLKNYQILQAIISRHATQADVTEWKAKEGSVSEVLGSEAGRWSGGAPNVGQHIYHYRTRTNRAFLYGFWSVLATFLMVFWAMPRLAPESDLSGLWIIVTLLSLLLLPMLYADRSYRAAAVRIDDAGIYQDTGFRTRFIPWDEVRECQLRKNATAKVIGENCTIRFWDNVADVEDLRAEIARRAVNCRQLSA
jgi:hypothetical protein